MAGALFPPGVPLVKRLFDLLVTFPLLVVALPVIGVLAVWVLVVNGRPVFFRQPRGGYRGRVFSVVKFRTMNSRRDSLGHLLPDAQRITPIGRWLRAASLDELPELLNILRGEMSLVGPRPLFAHYIERYTPEQARRHDVLPGITGWAQVNGRNNLSWEEKFRLDVWYVDHWSLALDLRILALTAWKVLTREGISQPGHATAEEFMGQGRSRPLPEPGESLRPGAGGQS